MEIETSRTENGMEIVVESEEKIAVVVEGEEERIYLPEPGGDDSTYYAESVEGLSQKGDVYTVFHEGEAGNVEIFSK